VKRWQPLWLLVALGLAFGVNEMTRPRFEYVLDDEERTTATGSLTLEQQDARHQFELATIRVVAGTASRMWGAPVVVRELWLRKVESDPKVEPDLELFADFGGAQPPIDAAAASIDVLKQRDLSIIPVAYGSDLRSRVRLPGATQPSLVRSGSLRIREAIELPATQQLASWQVTGDLSLTVEGDGEPVRLSGVFSTLLAWYR
jgi:hypothetical protein